MSYYLIGIGGTGAKCLEAFVQLSGAGLLKDNQDVKLLFVDADKSCGNLLRSQEVVKSYQQIQNLEFGDNILFRNKITYNKFWHPEVNNGVNLSTFFNVSALDYNGNKRHETLGLLYDTLFSEQEKETDLEQGFRGHPAIGAAVMAYAINPDKDETWSQILQNIANDKDAKIFLFASAFGGTGAAGFPTIAKILDSYIADDKNGKTAVKIGGALILPYFQLKTPPANQKNEMQANSSAFLLNTQAALNYYVKDELLKKIFKRIYLMGDNDLVELKEFHLGSKEQKNDANIIEIYAALAAFDFFNMEKFDKFETPMCSRSQIGTITWKDLPVLSIDIINKIKKYIRFLSIYYNYIYGTLKKQREEKPKTIFKIFELPKNKQKWQSGLLEGKDKGNVKINDNITWQKFEAIANHAYLFLNWLKQIEDNDTRIIELVSKELFDENAIKDNFDYNKIIPSTVNIDNKLTLNDIATKLAAANKNYTSSNTSGIGILLNELYRICE